MFKKLFKVAEISKFSQTDLMYYEDGLKYYRDLKNSFDTARKEKKRRHTTSQVRHNKAHVSSR